MMYNEDPREAYFARKEEEREARRDRWRLTAGVMEFIGVVLGCGAVLLLVLLIASLLGWLRGDLASTFSVFISMFRK